MPIAAPVDAAEHTLRASPGELFVTFTQLALSGFGGVLPVAYRVLVERKRWLAPAEFAEMLAVSQILPGAAICNISLLIGYRFGGIRGGIAALGGLICFPLILICLLGLAYQHYGNLQLVREALGGMAVVAAGLVFSTGLKMLRALPKIWVSFVFVGLAFTGVGVMRWPLLAVLGVLGLAATALAWRRIR